MKYPTVKFVFDRRRKASKTSPGKIELEIAFDRRQKFMTSGVEVYPDEWDPQHLVVRRPDYALLNIKLGAFRKPIDDALAQLMVRNEPFSFAWLECTLSQKKKSGSFVKFVSDRIEERDDIQEVTKKAHRSLLPALKSFKKISKFSDLVPARIRQFDEWLHSKHYKQSTVRKYHKHLKIYIHDAIAHGLMRDDPYVGIHIERGKPAERKYLDEAQIQKLMSLKLEDPVLIRARDLFVFQTFTGLAYADLCRFDTSTLEMRDGKYVVRGKRRKTGEQYYIVLLTPALEVLKKYDWKLPVATNQKYNSALKAIGVAIGKPITSHCARHTFATWCLNNGVSVETLAKFLGHSDIKSTMIYASIVDKTVERTFDSLERKIMA